MYDKIEQELTELEENLNKWFKEKWVRFGPDGKILVLQSMVKI